MQKVKVPQLETDVAASEINTLSLTTDKCHFTPNTISSTILAPVYDSRATRAMTPHKTLSLRRTRCRRDHSQDILR